MYFWEPVWYIGMYGSLATWLVFEYFTPRKSPSEWAREQAIKRLEQRGDEFGYPLPPHYRSQ
ncbi:hypothetical protein BC831DRAFT_449058 [Entophlyctis helioformis]|nr:hypothetical protein BC831DRAFT_449058 [Entophlyctis helioformis]